MKERWFFIFIVGLLVGNCWLIPKPIQASSNFYFTNLQVTTDDKTATVIWNVNQAATGVVSFGVTSVYNYWIQDTRFEAYHQTQLAGLLPETTYHFKIEARNNSGEVVITDDYTFVTKKENDTVAPKISNVRVNFITGNSITVSWETDKDADSNVWFDLVDGNLRNRRSDGTRQKIHDLTITGLKPATRYFYQVSSKDKFGNEARAGSFSVITEDSNDQNLSDIQIIYLRPFNHELTIDPYNVTIQLSTNRPVSGRIRYGEKTKSYNKSIDLSRPRAKDSYIYLKDLKPDTIYYYIFELTDVLGKRLTSQEYTFRTPPTNILKSPGTTVPAVTPAAPSSLPVSTTNYAYNKPRASLGAEQAAAQELYQGLVQRLGSRKVNAISRNNWYTLVKAYVYGEYPLEAISQAVKWGGYTVHPTIGWSAWKGTKQYYDYINK